ncbi:MAG: isoleucine--tRNA ligase [Bacteroidota bacterium]|nr:isoleucine--tRNA ligase [Bacteroidota bacterium]
MSKKFKEYSGLNLSQVNKDILKYWEKHDTFKKTTDKENREKDFIFYEGPPSANGKPGIHHVISRALKDTFCRYKTLKGYRVDRKAGWDTHGLPVELAVEKKLGITKDEIGKSISVEEYNKTCREEVLKYTDLWENITDKMGYWVDMDDPYITYDNKYIETVWWLLKQMYEKNLLYKGYTIQPYSPAAGTGLSSHELNLPGCYKDVKDLTATVLFKAQKTDKAKFLHNKSKGDVYFLAWTTTPWTLLSNTALAVGTKIDYLNIHTLNPYTGEEINIILAKSLLNNYFSEELEGVNFEDYKVGDKAVPFKIVDEFKGQQLDKVDYEQLLPYQQPEEGDAFKVLIGDFVTTEDGTGIVHIAPSFGADDALVAKKNGIGALTLVSEQGKFIEGVGEFSGRYVKNAYDKKLTEKDKTVDVDIVVKLKHDGKLFKSEKYEHSYPHCWRTDKPILYYPLDSWFVRSTKMKDRMVELNKTINWKPKETGEGRFGNWLENLIDWNLSRSRFWGTPLPIWRTADGEEEICIGSVEELKNEIEKSVAAGQMNENVLADFEPGNFSKENYDSFDLHRPFVDDIVLVSPTGKPMKRELDLIDVWFDSGAMPYAQIHYPFENKKEFEKVFPADFIAEGVDQTRGWFFTLHAISTMLFDSVAFKNIISTGMVLDKNGQKMSKSRPETLIDPFEAIEKHGSDPLRWYMLTNARPWDSLKFDEAGVEEVKRKFFGTLYNTYSFFSIYANLDNFSYSEKNIASENQPEIDRWIISMLNTLVEKVEHSFDNYEPTEAGRLIQEFVSDHLSNWYVRLNRKRFWGQDYNEDKISAYQTLYTVLKTVAVLMAPIAPFYADRLYQDLTLTSAGNKAESVHLERFPEAKKDLIDKDLEERMDYAQQISSMALGLRRKAEIKVRQPLQKIMLPILDNTFKSKVDKVKDIILSELNVKEVEYLSDASGVIVKEIKPDFSLLGRKYKQLMKAVAAEVGKMTQDDIAKYESNGEIKITVEGNEYILEEGELLVSTKDVPGLLAVSKNNITVALETTMTQELKLEGIAREIVNKVQNLRKDSGLELTDRIVIEMADEDTINLSIQQFREYISSQVLADKISTVSELDDNSGSIFVEIDEKIGTQLRIEKVQR